MTRISLNRNAAIGAGIIAGAVATAAQIVMWWIFLDAVPWMLYRDTRLTAAILMGRQVLPPPATLDWQIMMVAACIHFVISAAYGLILGCIIFPLGIKSSLVAGGIYGLILYKINMYCVTLVFPWFAEVRDWITIVAHIVFGISIAAAYMALTKYGLTAVKR